MKPPLEYRPKAKLAKFEDSPASSSGRTPDFGSGNGGSNPPAGASSGGMAEKVDAADLKSAGEIRLGSSPSAPTSVPVAQRPEPPIFNRVVEGSNPSGYTNDISRDYPGREVAVSVPKSARKRILKRDDEAVARRDSTMSTQSSQPPPSFDRVAYQREYMKDRTLAQKEGLTVKQWRVKHAKE